MSDLQPFFNWASNLQEHENTVQRAAWQAAMGALVHRMVKFGPDIHLINSLTARDLLHLACTFAASGQTKLGDWFLQATFARAIIENDMDMVDGLCAFSESEDVKWYRHIVGMLLKAHEEGKLECRAAEEYAETLPDEEKHVARLLIARSYPEQMKRNWLVDAENSSPRLQAEMMAILNAFKKHKDWCEEWCKGRYHVHMSV